MALPSLQAQGQIVFRAIHSSEDEQLSVGLFRNKFAMMISSSAMFLMHPFR